MFSRIYHFFKGPNPLHPSVAANRLSPLTFRRFEPRDLDRCLELHAINEPGRFPMDGSNEYEQCLANESSYFLVAEDGGEIVATGGVSYFRRKDMAVLCYGLVHPNNQGKGIGTALFLARLALLKPSQPVYRVFIFAVEASMGFYRRFGFYNCEPWKDLQGNDHPTGRLLFSSQEILRCRDLLKKHKITVPEDEDQIPLRQDE